MKKALFLILCLSSPCLALDFGGDGGVGGEISAGATVVNGTASRFVTTDSSGKLQTDSDTAFDGTAVTFTSGTLTTANIGTLNVSGNTALGDASVDSITQNAASVSYPNDTIITLGGGAGGLTITGDVAIASNTIIDAYTDSFGAVTAGSTSTVTYTEVVDRLGEFVTSSFTATLAGYYEIIAHAGVSQTAGTGCLILKKNNAALAGGTVCNQGVTGLASVLDISLTRILNLAANDILRIDADAITANATFQKMTLTIKRVP